MGNIGIRLEEKNGLFIASCKRLGIQAEAKTETEAVAKCRNSMVLCLRQALRELDNRTTDEENARLLIDLPEQDSEYIDEEDVGAPLPTPTLSERHSRLAERVKEAAPAFDNQFTVSAMAAHLAVSNPHLCQLLAAMAALGMAEKVKRGKYRMVSDAR